LVVAGGIRHGIEAANGLLIPLLCLTVIGLVVYSLSLDDADRRLDFLTPGWSAFTHPSVYIAAIGQAFFSLDIGMAVC
jgi:NSS family neurotransmitter:Na+ symporter